MKFYFRIVSFLLACLIFGTTSGFSLHRHFCGEVLKEVKICLMGEEHIPSEEELEAKCHPKKMSCEKHDEKQPNHQHEVNLPSCCDEEVQVIRLSTNLLKEELVKTEITPTVLQAITLLALDSDEESRYSNQLVFYEIPDVHPPPLYLQLQQLTYYG